MPKLRVEGEKKVSWTERYNSDKEFLEWHGSSLAPSSEKHEKKHESDEASDRKLARTTGSRSQTTDTAGSAVNSTGGGGRQTTSRQSASKKRST